MAPRISVILYTARGDNPFERREWHCFDPVVKTLAEQSFKDFELIVVDMHWETRSDWFKQNPQPFPVKHVPSSPNRWQEQKRTGLCAQINRGFAWADGELIWMCGENNLFPKTHLERAWAIYKKENRIPVAWYAICRIEAGAPHPDCPAEFDLLGYTHNHVQDMDHRAKQFAAHPSLQIAECPHNNYFGYSSVPTELALTVNGFDELFDGQWGLFDCDFGSRLDLAGGKMALARDLFIVEPPVVPGGYVGIGHHEPFKCHYAIYLHNRATNRRVNGPLPPHYAEEVKGLACYNQCSLKEKCKAGRDRGLRPAETPADQVGESAYYPFCEGKYAQMATDLFTDPPVRNLRTERTLRKTRRPPYDRGTFHRPKHV